MVVRKCFPLQSKRSVIMLKKWAIRGSLAVFWNKCKKLASRVKGVFASHLLFIAAKGEWNATLSLKITTEPMTRIKGLADPI